MWSPYHCRVSPYSACVARAGEGIKRHVEGLAAAVQSLLDELECEKKYYAEALQSRADGLWSRARESPAAAPGGAMTQQCRTAFVEWGDRSACQEAWHLFCHTRWLFYFFSLSSPLTASPLGL